MAMPLNKSPSLAASSRTTNPNARNSEINNPMRRSFGGNPFTKPTIIANRRSFNPNTPTNSPSDFPRRNSVGGRENSGFFPDPENKENDEKDQILKPGKVRSPAASKGTKNFMSATISASSKIIDSPRKKILIERNEPDRTSISSTDAKSPIRKVTFTEPFEHSDMKPRVGLEEKKLEEVASGKVPKEEEKVNAFSVREDLKGEEAVLKEMNITTNLNPNNETEFSFRNVNLEHDCVNLDPTFKLSALPPPPISATSTVLAPLDADLLLPPYDPERNYLSPRPQFLHYKPNPRVELYKEREGIDREDCLISGSSSDTEVTEEERESQSSKEVEDVYSDEAIKEEDRLVYETSAARILVSNEAVEAKEVHKPLFFTRSKAIALLLLLSVACLSYSVMNSPVNDPAASEVLTLFSKAYQSEFSKFAKAKFDDFSVFAKAKLDQLAQNFLIWFTNLICDLVATLRGVPNLGHFQFSNLTALNEDIAVDLYPIFGHGEKATWETSKGNLPVQNFGENDAATKISSYVEDISVEHYDSPSEKVVQQDIVEISGDENVSDAPESVEIHESNLVTAMERSELEQDPQQTEVSETNHSESDIDLKEDHPNLIVETTRIDTHDNADVFKETNFEVVEIQAQEIDAYANSVMDSNVDLKDHQPNLNSAVAEIHTELNDDGIGHIQLTEADRESAGLDAALRDNEQRLAAKFPPHMLLYLMLFLVPLIGAATFNFSKKNKSRTRVACSMEQPQLAKTMQMHFDSFSVPKEHISLDKPSFRNGPTEMDILGESYPSETNSFEKSSSFGQRVVKEVNEAPSLEQKPIQNYWRESLASSTSMGSLPSPSYGSFTTYEKLPIKHGHGDEKTITPVRRSSRIRNAATSPL